MYMKESKSMLLDNCGDSINSFSLSRFCTLPFVLMDNNDRWLCVLTYCRHSVRNGGKHHFGHHQRSRRDPHWGGGGGHTQKGEEPRKRIGNVCEHTVCVHIEYSICSSKTAITIQKSYGSLKPVAQGTSAAGNGFSLSRPTPTTSQGMLFSSVPSLD